MIGVPNPYVLLGGVAAIAAACGGSYLAGDSAGANRVIARDAVVMRKAAANIEKGREAIQTLQAAAATREDNRQEAVREIRTESVRIVSQPVYRDRCLPADGGGLLDRAITVANDDPGQPADIVPAAAAPPQAERR